MSTLSQAAREALSQCYATRGKHKGQLLARCPRSGTPAAAAWQGAMLSCNPYKVSIFASLMMSAEHQALSREVTNYFDALPKAERIAAQRDRAYLEALGAW